MASDPPTENSLRPYLALGVGILSVSMSAIFVSWAGAPGVVTSFYRMAIGAVIFTLPFVQRSRQKGMVPRRGALFALLAGAFFGVDMALWSTGITISGATNPTLMANTAPAWVGLGAMIFLGERPNRRFWAGLALALVGAAIILGVDGLRDFRFGLGSFYGLAAGVFYGGFFLLAQRGRVHIDSVRFFWFSVLGSAAVLFLISLLGGFSFVDYSSGTFGILLINGLVVQGLGWFAINYAQGFLPATIVSPTMLGQPVVTAVLAGLLLGEAFTPLQLVGGAAIMGGIYTVHWSRLRNA